MLNWIFGRTKSPTPRATKKPNLDISQLDVVGESFYQKQLDKICGGKVKGGHNLEKIGHLYPEPENPYDKNAVAVYIAQHQVGHLKKEDAIKFNKAFGRAIAVDLVIVGGWQDKNGDEGHYGVKLVDVIE